MAQQQIKFGRSLNPTPVQLRIGYLQKDLEMVNRTRGIDGLKPISHAELVHLRTGKIVYEWINQPFDRMKYYIFVSKYNNNYSTKRNFYEI